MKTITIDECTKMIRAALKQGFPNTKFSVRKTRSTYSHNIDVSWTDGPTTKQIEPILNRFESKGFDGSTDCQYYCGKRILCGVEVEVSGNYVRGSRTISSRLRSLIAEKIGKECGLENLELNEWGQVKGSASENVPFAFHAHYIDTPYITFEQFQEKKYVLASDSNGRGEWFSNLLYRVESVVSLEEQKPIAPELLPEYIDVNATVSTGRASFEEPQKMFAGHVALDEASSFPQKSFAQECAEYLAEQKKAAEEKADQEVQEAINLSLNKYYAGEFNCSVGRSYTREEYKQRTATPGKVAAVTDRIQ